MSSKESILKSIRAQRVPPADLPSLACDWIRYDDPLTQFRAVLESVGGRFVPLERVEDLPGALAGLDGFAEARQIVSLVSDVPSTVALDAIDDPHELERLDWAIMPGELAVAENGAIWVSDEHVKHRAVYFIAQHVSIVIDVRSMVHNMHEAYERIAIDRSSLGLFISGPSKTADIEQSLVIGAQGPRSLTVFCVMHGNAGC